jgi:hypothetical protein
MIREVGTRGDTVVGIDIIRGHELPDGMGEITASRKYYEAGALGVQEFAGGMASWSEERVRDAIGLSRRPDERLSLREVEWGRSIGIDIGDAAHAEGMVPGELLKSREPIGKRSCS